MSNYILITSINHNSFSAEEFDTKAAANKTVERLVDDLGYDVDPKETDRGYWSFQHNRVFMSFERTYLGTATAKYWIRRFENNKLVETRRFLTRRTAVGYVAVYLNRIGSEINPDESEAGSWTATDGDRTIKLQLTIVIEENDLDVHYDTLGISRNAGQQEVKRAYREKVKVTHPDRGGSEHAMAKLNETYGLLARKIESEESDNIREFLSVERNFLITSLKSALFPDPIAQQISEVAPTKSGTNRGGIWNVIAGLINLARSK